MLRTSIKMIFSFDREHDAMQILHNIILKTRTRFGCLCCSLYRDTESANTLIYEDEWSNIVEMNLHLRSKEYEKLLLVMEMAQQPPRVEFSKTYNIAGMELIEKTRCPDRRT